MDVFDRLQQAEVWLTESKRAGAILEIIDVCRQQQAQLVQLHQEVRALKSDAQDAILNNTLLGAFGLDGD